MDVSPPHASMRRVKAIRLIKRCFMNDSSPMAGKKKEIKEGESMPSSSMKNALT
jgi:hypothetical protein